MFVGINRSALLLLIMLLFTQQANSQSTSWTDNGATNDFFDPANWSDGVPEPEISAVFWLSTTYSVKLTAAAEADTMSIDNGSVTLQGGGEFNVNFLPVRGGVLTIEEPQTRVRSDGSVFIGQPSAFGTGAIVRIVDGGELDTLSIIDLRRDSSIETNLGTLVADRIRVAVTDEFLSTLFVENESCLMIMQDLVLGQADGATGHCVVDSSIAIINDRLQIGVNGAGELIIANGSAVSVGGTTEVQDDSTLEIIGNSIIFSEVECDGTLITGGNAQIDGNLFLMNSGMADIGSLEVSGDYRNRGAGSIVSDANGTVEIGGVYEGAAPFLGNGTIRFGGPVELGDFTDFFQIVDFSENTIIFESGSSYEFQFCSAAEGDHDRVRTESQVNIEPGASLVVNSCFDYEINPEETLTLIERAPGSTGEFDGLPEGASVTLPWGERLTISYLGGPNEADVVFTYLPPLLGDVNLDSVVNLLDVTPFIERLSNGPYQAEADCNEDGFVNLLDVDSFISILNNG